jgi:hypothetical protein
MGRIADVEELTRHVVTLRHAEGRSPEVAQVRRALERRVGPTLSPAVAARLLGISHATLRRWIELEDVPVLTTPRGRREVPTRFITELLAELGARDATPPPRFPLADALRARRTKSQRLLDAARHGGRPDGEASGQGRAAADERALR